MSGGAFDYLCDFDAGAMNAQLEAMAAELRRIGFHDLASMTLSLRFDPPQPLRDAWRAVEWWASCDTSVRDAVLVCEGATRDLKP